MELLNGVKIIDFTHAYAGPFATLNLADFGAEVIKIEKLKTGDQSHSWGPFSEGKSAYYHSFNRGKKSISLDLSSQEGKKIIMELVKDADMVFENFKAGSIDRLGLGYEDLKKVNPEIIFVSNSGYGTEGPYKNDACYDIIAQAMAGVIASTGFPNDTPSKVGPSIGDNYSGLMMLQGALLAYFHKLKTGKGQKVEISMYDCLFSMLDQKIFETTKADQENRTGNTNSDTSPENIYQTKDAYIYFCITDDIVFQTFAEKAGLQTSIGKFTTNAERVSHFSELDQILKDFFSEKTVAELKPFMDNCYFTKVYDLQDVTECKQLNTRNMILPMDSSCIKNVNMAGNPMKLSLTPPIVRRSAPEVGEHTYEILSELGYSQKYIKELCHKNVAYISDEFNK